MLVGTLPLPSETIEPLLAAAIGMLHAEWEASKKNITAARRYYLMAKGINRVCLVNRCAAEYPDPMGIHASIAMNNTLVGVSKVIEHHLGRSPISEGW